MSNITFSFIDQKPEWEQFIATRSEANFLQAWNWGVFHQSLGKKVFYCAWKNDQVMVAGAVVVKETAKRGTYLTIAGGPLMDWHDQSIVKQVFGDLTNLAKQERASFFRFRPQAETNPQLIETVKVVGAHEAPMHLTADLTLQLDLNKDDETLLAEMRKSTRYEIRKAEKLGITVEISTNPAEIKLMHEHQLDLAKQHGFVPFSLEFWQKQFEAFAVDNQVALFHSKLNGEILATAFIIFYNREAVYHYGTSTPANAKQPGSYAAQWAAIQEARRRGCQRYNFWGIAPEGHASHRFAGVSLFKRGFGGHEVAYLPAHDVSVKWSYHLTRQFELLRKKLRRL